MTVFELLLPSRAPIASRQVSIDADYLILYDYAVISLIPVLVALPRPGDRAPIWHFKEVNEIKPSAQMTVFELLLPSCAPIASRQVSIDADYLILYDYAVISLIPVLVALPTSKAALGASPLAGQAIEHLYGTLKRSTKLSPRLK
ncbi:hypothetical protein EVAR_90912_1 [Eumeta japonica]|uniref:Uncharacterized protein n=1 Tax=Eumeta variegata TaxID=151549 RepID=A0A4C2A2F2_EUMVA|nr:hypothetical protein EVAR_90912_1 [Eumeta japonica]